MRKFFDPLVKNTLLISAGGLIVKFLGALYRIPLNNVLKAEGLGIYQTAFPAYLILLTFSGASATSAVTKITASGDCGEGVLKNSLKVILPFGIFGWFFMSIFSGLLSRLQGNSAAKYSYIALAPSLVFVSVISCIRGYFQGKNDMKPTVISQIAEQTVKIAVGLLLCYSFGTTPEKGAFFACAAVSLSECAAMIYLVFKYKKHSEKQCDNIQKYPIKRLIAQLLPIALTSSIIPFARLFDSFTVVNVLKTYLDNATELYGLYSGSVESIIGMPVAVCYGISASVLPGIAAAEAKGENQSSKRLAVRAFSYTLFLSSIAFAFIALLPKPIVSILFSGLNFQNKAVLIRLISLSAINIVLLSVIQTETSVLVAKGKPFAPALSLLCGFIFKAVAQLFLLKKPELNVYGILYSDIICYFVAVFSNLVYIISIYSKYSKRKNGNEVNSCGSGSNPGRLIAESLGTDEKNG